MDHSSSRQDGRAEQVVLEIDADVAILRLGFEDERVVTLTERRMQSFLSALDEVEANESLRGLVITGANPTMFCAGADINAIRDVTDVEVARRLAKMGQDAFTRLERVKIPTVAAISGPCVGGGCEMVLACRYRILADTPETRIGLPEIKLGIIPGFGGTQRLPRLIGLPQALDIILKGKVVPPAKALQVGLADSLVTGDGEPPQAVSERLEKTAISVARGEQKLERKKLALRDQFLTFSGVGRWLVERRVRLEVLKQTKGHYPAPPRAITASLSGLREGMTAGLDVEATALAELIVTPESKSLVHIYFLTDETSKRWRGVKSQIKDLRVSVIGGGTMGAGIAAALLASDFPTTLIDSSAEARERARKHITDSLSKRTRKAVPQIDIKDSLDAASGSGLVIEAIFEDLDVKRKLLSDLAERVDQKTVLASNTSSLPISAFSADVPNSGRVIGMHFFNPAEKMPLVEVVCPDQTDERTIAFTAAVAVKMGKYPVVVREVPGFLVNRVLSPYLGEAAWILSDGYGIETIDRVATDFGMPMGPLRLLDEVGLDVAGHVAAIMEASYGERMKGPKFAERLVKAGRFGRKKGGGFYRYEGREAVNDPTVPSILGLTASRGTSPQEKRELTDRLILSMVNEAIRCLDEGVAGVPGSEAAGQIDLGTVMGIGFAPFRGGVLHYAESLGAREILGRIEALAAKLGARFAPAEGLRARAASGGSFYRSID